MKLTVTENGKTVFRFRIPLSPAWVRAALRMLAIAGKGKSWAAFCKEPFRSFAAEAVKTLKAYKKECGSFVLLEAQDGEGECVTVTV